MQVIFQMAKDMTDEECHKKKKMCFVLSMDL